MTSGTARLRRTLQTDLNRQQDDRVFRGAGRSAGWTEASCIAAAIGTRWKRVDEQAARVVNCQRNIPSRRCD